MPDVHAGIGATVGSVIACKRAVIPAAVGVDIGCGMMAVKTSLSASQLPDDLRPLRLAIRRLLDQAQHDVVRSNIDLSNLTRELGVTRQREAISRETAEIKLATRLRQDELARELAASELATLLARIGNALHEAAERHKLVLTNGGG